ncbi:MAG TPA: exopolyphosphatase [Gaiellaceae bacterium]|nr:exopolyphosphatase [Gaiellaceae bacterium]
MRVAAVDLGTNTTRLLVADVADGRVEEVHRETHITRLGEGVDTRGRLLPVPIARVRNVLTDYRRTLESLGAERTLAVATSAVRDAENREAFLGEVEWSYGFATQLVTGEEEAELTRRGVAPSATTLVLDLGGGSTELILDGFHTSLPMGSVRFTERFGEDVAACRTAARELLPDLAPKDAIGVAGTVATIAALAGEGRLTRAHAREQLERLALERLAAMSVDARRAVPEMDPERAPVIVAGAAILVEALERYGLESIEFSERDLLDGIALAAAELPEPVEGDAPPGAYTCC